MMKNIALYLWQFPQHLLALLLFAVLDMAGLIFMVIKDDDTICFIMDPACPLSCFSLGRYIFFDNVYAEGAVTPDHESGHSKQSLYLGPLYLLIIGIPSALGNLHARIARKDSKWYYGQPWEAWADRLGGVNRAQ